MYRAWFTIKPWIDSVFRLEASLNCKRQKIIDLDLFYIFWPIECGPLLSALFARFEKHAHDNVIVIVIHFYIAQTERWENNKCVVWCMKINKK